MLYLGPGKEATFNAIIQTPISEETKDRGAVNVLLQTRVYLPSTEDSN